MNRKGFTLIELLVVVAVLALLASIVFSNLGGAREGARISNALSFQSQTHSLLGSDLIGWWNFNEGSGTTARDISGYDNHGTIVGATYVDGVPGTGGTALEFDGVDDYVNIGTPSELNISNQITISAWINVYDVNEIRGIISRHTGPDNAAGSIRVKTNRGIAVIINIGGVYSSFDSSNEVIELNNWHHIVYTYNGSKEYIYNNTDIVGERSNSGVIYTPVAHNIIGRTINSYVNGLIDDVRIYSRALTASEIQILYAQTKNNYLVNE